MNVTLIIEFFSLTHYCSKAIYIWSYIYEMRNGHRYWSECPEKETNSIDGNTVVICTVLNHSSLALQNFVYCISLQFWLLSTTISIWETPILFDIHHLVRLLLNVKNQTIKLIPACKCYVEIWNNLRILLLFSNHPFSQTILERGN